jgi:hypothetical protein
LRVFKPGKTLPIEYKYYLSRSKRYFLRAWGSALESRLSRPCSLGGCREYQNPTVGVP